MLGAIERYIKQAIVDRNAMVSSSALVAGKHSCFDLQQGYVQAHI
jgi:hypothetical protein